MTLTAEQKEFVVLLRADATALKAHAGTSGKLSAEGCLAISREIMKAAALIISMGGQMAVQAGNLKASTDAVQRLLVSTDAADELIDTLSLQLEEAKNLLGGAWVHVPDKPEAPRLNDEISAFLKGGKQDE